MFFQSRCQAAQGLIVVQKLLDSPWISVVHLVASEADMSNYFLSKDKQIAVISALAEGASIRGTERMTGVHRDTIMRLGVRIGQGCAKLLDAKMRNLDCKRIELDEIWGFIWQEDAACPAYR